MQEEKTPKKKSTDGVPPVDVVLPDSSLIYWLYELRLPLSLSSEEQKVEARQRVLDAIEREEMLPLYISLCDEFGWDVDEGLKERLAKANEEEKRALEVAFHEAEENFGDVEVKDATLAQAHFHCRIGDIQGAIQLYEASHNKTIGAGSKLDVTLTLVRLSLLYGMRRLTKKHLEKAKVDCEKGGDWERRNKLKIYEAFYLAQNREFNESVQLLLECVAIFTATELISFESFIFATVLLGMFSLERPALRSQVIQSPEVAQVLAEDSVLKDFLHSYFYCRYDVFLQALVDISKRIQRDFFLSKHMRYYVRAIRLKVYRQFLEPFRSVTIQSMSDAFACSPEFIEADVADYVANGKLNCKIDRVAKVVECERKNSINDLYADTIKQGDTLLSKIQKLSKIIDM